MTEPWEDHYRLVTAESWRVVSCVVRTRNEEGIAYVLIGGWALYAYGSPVPSVDADLFIRGRDFPRLQKALLDRCGVVPNGKLQLLPLEKPLLLTPRTVAEERGPHGYTPVVLLSSHRVQPKTLRLPGTELSVIVPRPPELAFAKLKALHDRRLAWESITDPRVMATLPGIEQARVRGGTEAGWRRKAGKDYFDFAFLLRGASMEEVLKVAKAFGLQRPLEASLRVPPQALRTFAESLAQKNPDLGIRFPFW